MRPSLFTILLFEVLTIQTRFYLSLTPCLCSNIGLAFQGFAFHIKILLEPNPLDWRAKP
jgi:hypothetical protein